MHIYHSHRNLPPAEEARQPLGLLGHFELPPLWTATCPSEQSRSHHRDDDGDNDDEVDGHVQRVLPTVMIMVMVLANAGQLEAFLLKLIMVMMLLLNFNFMLLNLLNLNQFKVIMIFTV